MAETSSDHVAEWYAVQAQVGILLHAFALPHLLDLIGDCAGQMVCDLACGEGHLSHVLAERGAQVTGIDISPRLLAVAQQAEAATPRGVHYLLDDPRQLSLVADAQFDGVVCYMALMDMGKLDAVLGTVRRVLRPGGWLVGAVPHPCFQTPASAWDADADGRPARHVRAYFKEGFWVAPQPIGVRGRVGSYHRTLSTYLNALLAAGFTLRRVEEPVAPPEVVERVPEYAEVPVALLFRCETTGASASLP